MCCCLAFFIGVIFWCVIVCLWFLLCHSRVFIGLSGCCCDVYCVAQNSVFLVFLIIVVSVVLWLVVVGGIFYLVFCFWFYRQAVYVVFNFRFVVV